VTDVDEYNVGPVTDNDASANSVAENASLGDTVGITALSVDTDGTDTVTYSLSDDAGGLFAIDANTGVITVANTLDYETAASHSVTVLTTSTDGSTSSQAFTVTITDVNESAGNPVTPSGPPAGDNGPGRNPGISPGSGTDLEDPAAGEPGDPVVDLPIDETSDEEPVIDNSPLESSDDYLAPDDPASHEDSSAIHVDPLPENTPEIIFLNEESDADDQSEGRTDVDDYIYFDNGLYKEIAAENDATSNGQLPEPTPVDYQLTDINGIEISEENWDRLINQEEYDRLREEIDETFRSEQHAMTVKTNIVMASITTLTVGVVSYLLRAGSLIASMMSTLPIWRSFDPIVIFSGKRKEGRAKKKPMDDSDQPTETLFDPKSDDT
jgi:hypothetical protein